MAERLVNKSTVVMHWSGADIDCFRSFNVALSALYLPKCCGEVINKHYLLVLYL